MNWKPISEYPKNTDKDILISTADGTVCTAYWQAGGNRFLATVEGRPAWDFGYPIEVEPVLFCYITPPTQEELSNARKDFR